MGMILLLYSFFNLEKVPNYVIEDPAYPLTYLMKENDNYETNAEVIFNNVL